MQSISKLRNANNILWALSKRSVHHHPFHFLVNAKLHNQITPADLGESQRKKRDGGGESQEMC